ncbi:MAG: AmmeMemoRadiSam system protein B, partial [Ignavibacteria bacterium RIFOXYA2_FULL_37_17]
MKNIREPAVAGMFYPASADKLKSQIKMLLDANKPAEHF